MKTLKNRLVSKCGLNKNKVVILRKALKEAVLKVKDSIPLTDNYNREIHPIGCVTNLVYKNGNVYGDINIDTSYNIKDKIGRLSFECEKMHKDKKGNTVLDMVAVYDCGFIKTSNDGLNL